MIPHRTVRRLLCRQSVGGVRLLGRHVVWRRGEGEYAVWRERNVYSPAPTGCRLTLGQAIRALTRKETNR